MQHDPTFRCEIGGQIKSSRLSLSERFVIAGQYLAGNCDDAITVMVVEEIREGLFANQKLRVRSVNLARNLRKRERNLGETSEAWVFNGTLCHNKLSVHAFRLNGTQPITRLEHHRLEKFHCLRPFITKLAATSRIRSRRDHSDRAEFARFA